MMEQAKQTPGLALARLAGSILLAAAILIGCGILAKSFANNYYSSGGYSFPGSIEARIQSLDSDYLTEQQAMNHLGFMLSNAETELWDSLLAGGELDGTYVTFKVTPRDDEFEYPYNMADEIRVYSKTKLDAWMQTRFGD